MAQSRDFIRFLLNDEALEVSDVSPHATLLDYVRLHARLKGTKEGCAEGDCGACTVLIGRLDQDKSLKYETVNACIRFLASLDGCHVVTIEHLSRSGALHPIQDAMVRLHGSQCGFCTPGIVMSLYGLWLENPSASVDEIRNALQGNLCRCTGYAPIIRAAQSVMSDPKDDPLSVHRVKILAQLTDWDDGTSVALSHGQGRAFVPNTVKEFAEILEKRPRATIVAGATDVGLWVTKNMRDLAPVVHTSKLNELRQISVSQKEIKVGAGVSYSQLRSVLVEELPGTVAFWDRIGGVQIRNMGTIGGNIANGSPIGDTPPLLIALGAKLILRKGTEKRFMPLEEFFLAYGKQDLANGEFVESVEIPKPQGLFAVHKISKRRDEDISTLCGAFHLQIDQGIVKNARIAFGGMAPIPKRALAAENAFREAPWSLKTIATAKAALHEDFTPISDARASAEYRMLAAQNLLERVYKENMRET